MDDKKRRLVERLASALGLTPEDVTRLRQQVASAESSLTGTKAEKRQLVSRRLSITPAEVKILRTALLDPGSTNEAARLIARHVVSLPTIQSTFPVRSAKSSIRSSVPTVAKSSQPATPNRFRKDWHADTNVFVTPWGDVVHMYADCFGTRGFRHGSDPDPVIHQARLRDPICGDRRACRMCFDYLSRETLDRFDEFLEALHGGRRTRTASRKGPIWISGGARLAPPEMSPSKKPVPQRNRAAPTPVSRALRGTRLARTKGPLLVRHVDGRVDRVSGEEATRAAREAVNPVRR